MASRGLISGMSAENLHFLSAITISGPLSRPRCFRHHISSSKAPYSSRIDPNAPDLIEWIRDEGGFVHPGLKLDNEYSSGLGLVSSRVISAGTDIISLPRHIPLALPSPHSSLDQPDAVIIDLARRLPEELWTLRLGLKLLGERAKVGSFWWPYISNLPQAFNVPIFFSKVEIESLQYIPLIHQVNKRCKLLLGFEKVVKSVVEHLLPEQHPFGGQCVDAAALGWAMSAVSTRAFRLHDSIMSDGKRGSTPMLLPLIDMCNHDFQANARIVQEADSNAHKSFVKVVAEKQIGEHTPISLNYGSLCNDLFLLDYGFIIPENEHDYVELKYDKFLLDAAAITAGVQSTAFTSAPWQQEVLSQLKLHGDQAIAKVTLGGTNLVDGRLLAALRILFSKDIESIRKHDLSTLQSLTVEGPIGVVNERNVLRTIIALCVIALGYFPTKMIEDEMMLRKGGNSEAMKLAIAFRISKKELLIHIMKNLTRRLKNLR